MCYLLDIRRSPCVRACPKNHLYLYNYVHNNRFLSLFVTQLVWHIFACQATNARFDHGTRDDVVSSNTYSQFESTSSNSRHINSAPASSLKLSRQFVRPSNIKKGSCTNVRQDSIILDEFLDGFFRRCNLLFLSVHQHGLAKGCWYKNTRTTYVFNEKHSFCNFRTCLGPRGTNIHDCSTTFLDATYTSLRRSGKHVKQTSCITFLKKPTLACGWHIPQSTAARSRSSRHEKTNSFKMIEILQCLASSLDFLSPVPLLSFLHGAMLPSSLSRGWAPGFQRGFCREHKFRGKKERPYSSNQVVLILSFLHTLNA